MKKDQDQPTTRDLLKKYDEWEERRACISLREDEPGGVSPGEWADSDDDAVDLLREMAGVLRSAGTTRDERAEVAAWVDLRPETDQDAVGDLA